MPPPPNRKVSPAGKRQPSPARAEAQKRAEDARDNDDARADADERDNGKPGAKRVRIEALRKRAKDAEAEARALRDQVAALTEAVDQANRASKRGNAAPNRAERRLEREQAKLRQALHVAARERGLPAPATPVFFVTGRAKSGTSWLMRLLNAHPDVLCQGEGRIFGLDYKRPDILRMSSKTLQPSSLHRAILDDDYLRAWVERSVWTRNGDVDEQLSDITRVITNHFMAAGATHAGARIVGDKTPFIGGKTMSEIATVYPGAKVIHIIRDGRDVAVSAMHHLWERKIDLAGGNDLKPEEVAMRDEYRADPDAYLGAGKSIFAPKRLTETARDWGKMVTQATDDGPRLLGQDYAEVRYEDLLQRPSRELARLLTFIGAAADDAVVASCVKAEAFARRTKGRQPGDEDSAHLLRMGVAGDWRRVFSDDDKERFKAAAGKHLVTLGYERDMNW